MDIQLRHALASEGDLLAEIDQEEGGFKTKPEEFVESDRRQIIVAHSGDTVLGYMLLEIYPREIYLHKLFVRPAYRRNKVARRLVSWLTDQLPHYKRDRISLTTGNKSQYAKRCYYGLGFVLESTIPPNHPRDDSGLYALCLRYKAVVRSSA